MEQNVLAHFTVTVTSAENASWQGVVESNGKNLRLKVNYSCFDG